ncbi:MAG: transporter substrate-binding domain-containing protein [Methylococcaceae bacterium]|nr:transporter substrate-binding domain-containing protein [Methylococcaceae bacterium]
MKFRLFLLSCAILFSSPSFSAEKNTLRIAVLAFGTVNWELTTLKNQQLLSDADFKLEIQHVASPQAGKIALQSGAVDMIVSDWIWVSRLRSTGSDYTFYPYSTTSGALIVAENSSIKSLADLQGKKLGIAGGELDKNWLLLQTLAQQQNQLDLDSSVEKVYGAPPLLNQQLLHDRVDAVINYWHFAARLEAKGYKQLMNGKEILQQLGITAEVPTLGYVFNRDWGLKNPTIIQQFLTATQQAKNQLCESNEIWKTIIPLTKAKDSPTENKLRERYCAGRIKQWGKTEQQAAAKIYQLLRKLSHNKLTGQAETIQPGTFWNIKPQS